MNVLVVAPHPDDETLGCGGTLLKHVAAGESVHWLIITKICENQGWSESQREKRRDQIHQVAENYKFSAVHQLDFATSSLDHVPLRDVIQAISRVISKTQPRIVYMPHRGDAHSDHKVVFDATSACTKWFRYPSIKRVLSYETLSETGFSVNPESKFTPNCYVDISRFLDRKLNIMQVFDSEMGNFPFPRSLESIRALAALRGSESGFQAAEAFQLLRELLD